MAKRLKAPALVAVACAVTMPLVACSTPSGTSSTAGAAASAKGGTVYVLTKRSAEHLDPQRMYIGRDLAYMGRIAYRSLLTFKVTKDATEANTPVPDLATDTGKSENGGKQWSFTLKDGVKWQDGKDITCDDLKYGVSRTFATDVITGGPNYILGMLDVPTDPATKLPTYQGPFKKTGQADFDKAVTCSGKTITYKFNKPWPDFPLAIMSLRAFDPYRADQDKGDASNFAVFSSGPYMLDGAWTKGTGGTFVRNPNWDAKTDTVRTALPDKFVFTEGLTNEVINQRLISDGGNDQMAVTDRVVPPAMYGDVTGAVADRSVKVESPYVNYLVPNFKVMTNAKVRAALALATDRAAYAAALGGENASKPAKSIINPSLVGYAPNPTFANVPVAGDTEGAKKLLAEAGVSLPVKIKYTYSGGTPTSDKSAAALKAGWDKAGFETTLDPLSDTYYDVIQNPASQFDVAWGGWGADWPSASTVIPALFDSRLNITEKSNGQDYGNYASDAVNKAIDDAANMSDIASAGAAYAKIDATLGQDTAYIPLDITMFFLLHGSKITGYVNNPGTSMYVDLAGVGVKS